MNLNDMNGKEAEDSAAGNTDLSKFTDDQLQAYLDGDQSALQTEPPEPEPEPSAEPEKEPEAEVAEAAPSEEPDSADSEPAEAEPTTETPAEPADERDLLLEELRDRNEIFEAKQAKLDAEIQRLTFLADRHAGRSAHFEKLLREGGQKRSEPSYDTIGDEPGEVSPIRPVTQVPQEIADEVSQIRSERVARELQREATEFQQRHASFYKQVEERDGPDALRGIQNEVAKRVQASAALVNDVIYGDDAKLSAITARGIFEAAIADARVAYLESRRATNRERRDALLAKVREKKAQADIAQSSATAGPQPAKAKALSRLSDAELEAQIDSLSKEGAFDTA